MIKIDLTGMDAAVKRLTETEAKIKALAVVKLDQAQLAQRYAEVNKRRGIPVRSGRLRRALTDPGDPHFLAVVAEDGQSARLGTTLPYAGRVRSLRPLTDEERQQLYAEDLRHLIQEVLR